ncbi:MAG: arsenic resistance N-acetyltransferase ArsN2 [Gammaproteobacteria bacterium]|nr:arsenic resistance N-acetyltransferase ArsN2 [Gammaproteobacteria bacterium]MDH4314211.1 arsenic resistance N-acetyltransferase ArsN2 [Gammaproteobacteria bacterium]MDH5213242.1 arsenic resistance N-acetyltransferase ArsN2 [Gammaproteobacteria bacterium]MDH5499479.1 arsenic resistance N-acetyltransferase ArsN2 [Gammaproteobacteria bacterium]
MTSELDIEIRAGTEQDWPQTRNLLTCAGLPVADLDSGSMRHFLVASSNSSPDKALVGAVALQRFASIGLLRSLVVDSSTRTSGLGTRLLRQLEGRANELGVTELWLLTIDADAFFATRGYRVVSRAKAPSAIRATPEFSKLCPDSAALMVKSLG